MINLLGQEQVLLEASQFYALLAMQVLILSCMFAGFWRMGRNQQRLAELLRLSQQSRED